MRAVSLRGLILASERSSHTRTGAENRAIASATSPTSQSEAERDSSISIAVRMVPAHPPIRKCIFGSSVFA